MAPLSRRLEIAFWTGWVSTLRLIQVTPWEAFLKALALGCLGFLMVGISASYLEHRVAWRASSANTPPKAALSAAANAASDLTAHAAGSAAGIGPVVLPATERSMDTQVNVLLLIVDRLGGLSPRLQGAWLMVSDPQNQNLTFLPLYPSAATGSTADDLSRTFHLDPTGAPSQAFLKAVQQKDVWWHHYLIFDHAALAALVELVGGVGLGNGMLTGAQAVAALPPAGRDLEKIQEGQAMLLEAICRQSDRLFEAANPDLIAGLLTGTDRSDISPETFQQGWRAASRADGLACEFPTVLGR